MFSPASTPYFSSCPHPLVYDQHGLNRLYSGLLNCSYPCQKPWFSANNYTFAQMWAACCSCIAVVVNVVALFTFIIAWNQWSAHPRRILFHIHMCHFLVGIGWTVQLWPGMYHKVACHVPHNLQRLRQPGANTDWIAFLPCVGVFLLIYVPSLVAFLLVTNLFRSLTLRFGRIRFHLVELMLSLESTELNHLTLRGPRRWQCLSEMWLMAVQNASLSSIDQGECACLTPCRCCAQARGTCTSKLSVVLAWAVGLAGAVLAILLSAVDGDPVNGICFITQDDLALRILLLVAPMSVVLLCIVVLALRGVCILTSLLHLLQRFSPVLNPDHATLVSTLNTTRVCLLLTVTYELALLAVSCSFHGYHFTGLKGWNTSLVEKILCDATSASKTNSSCPSVPESRPHLAPYLAHSSLIFLHMLLPLSMSMIRTPLWRVWAELLGLISSPEYSVSRQHSLHATLQNHGLLKELQTCGLLGFGWWDPGVFLPVEVSTACVEPTREPCQVETQHEMALWADSGDVAQTAVATVDSRSATSPELTASLPRRDEEARLSPQPRERTSAPGSSNEHPGEEPTIRLSSPTERRDAPVVKQRMLGRNFSDRQMTGFSERPLTIDGLRSRYSFHYQRHYLPSSVVMAPATSGVFPSTIASRGAGLAQLFSPGPCSPQSPAALYSSGALVVPGSQSGQSYNSYHLLMACRGIKHDEWRTRMRLLGALRWSNMLVSYLQQTTGSPGDAVEGEAMEMRELLQHATHNHMRQHISSAYELNDASSESGAAAVPDEHAVPSEPKACTASHSNHLAESHHDNRLSASSSALDSNAFDSDDDIISEDSTGDSDSTSEFETPPSQELDPGGHTSRTGSDTLLAPKHRRDW